MYPNPFDRKHSTIHKVIEKLFRPDSIRSHNNKNNKHNSNSFFSHSPLTWRKKPVTTKSNPPPQREGVSSSPPTQYLF